MKKAFQIIGGSILLLVALSLPIRVTIITLILPEEYESRTRIAPAAGTIVPREIAIIQSRGTLFPVITNLGLQKQFARRFKEDELPIDITYKLLQSQLKIRHDTRTELIEIAARSESREEAARIANEIAKVYRLSTATTNGGATAVAKIIDAAEPALRPVYPNTLLNISISLGFALILGISSVRLIVTGARRRNVPPELQARRSTTDAANS